MAWFIMFNGKGARARAELVSSSILQTFNSTRRAYGKTRTTPSLNRRHTYLYQIERDVTSDNHLHTMTLLDSDSAYGASSWILNKGLALQASQYRSIFTGSELARIVCGERVHRWKGDRVELTFWVSVIFRIIWLVYIFICNSTPWDETSSQRSIRIVELALLCGAGQMGSCTTSLAGSTFPHVINNFFIFIGCYF